MTVKQLLEKDDCKYFLFADDHGQCVYEDAGSGERMKFGKLRIVDKYDERYLLLHSVCVGRIYHEAAVIPLYLPTTLVIAVAMATGDHTDFYKTMLRMHHFVRSIPEPVAFPLHLRDCDDIMIFDKKPKEGHYDVLQPARYTTLSCVLEEITKVGSHAYTSLIGASSKKTLQRPLPKPPKRMKFLSFKKRQTDNVEMPKSPSKKVLVDNYGGARGPGTNIGQLVGRGYHIVTVNPRLAVQELQKVLQTGLIPHKSLVEMADLIMQEKPKYSSIYESIEPRAVCSCAVSDNIQRIDLTSNFKSDVQRQADTQQDQKGQGDKTVGCSDFEGIKLKVERRRINKMDDVPEELSRLDCEGVGQCLALLHLARHGQKFNEAQIDGRLLSELDAEILQMEFEFSKFEALKLMKFIGGWRPSKQKAGDED